MKPEENGPEGQNEKAENGKTENGNGEQKRKVLSPEEVIQILRNFNVETEDIAPLMDSLAIPYQGESIFKHYWTPGQDKRIKIGLISDTHLAHKKSDLSILHTIYDEFKKQGVSAVYHCGDIIEGVVDKRRTHPAERLAHTIEDQVDHLLEAYPDIGVNTYYLEGWHPRSFFKNKKNAVGTSMDGLVKDIRPDLVYLGAFEADVKLSPKVLMRLSHHYQRTPVAVSYHPQGEVDSLSGGSKPDLFVIGGTHQLYNIPDYRGIAVYLAGTTQRQTQHMRLNKRPASLGAFVLDMELFSDKRLKDIRTTVLPFY